MDTFCFSGGRNEKGEGRKVKGKRWIAVKGERLTAFAVSTILKTFQLSPLSFRLNKTFILSPQTVSLHKIF
jgi:hypothetical protein